MQPRDVKWYGWRRDLPDFRDHRYKLVHYSDETPIPGKVNLKPNLGLTFNQSSLGSCTANSSSWCFQYVHGKPANDPYWSRMFLYVESLLAEGSYPQDAGAELRDVMKVMASTGMCPESDDPYNVNNFPSMPNAKAVADAQAVKLVNYTRLNGRQDFLHCLASGFPFVFGFTVYQSFESDTVAKTGIVPMPGDDESQLGGHAVCAIGYDQNFQGNGLYYLVQNSWGTDWGIPEISGCFWMPAGYLENPDLASDYWTMRR